jgi:hypothetical protein
MLPPGTLRYLKGHHDGIVIVVLAAMGAGSCVAGAPWPFGVLLLGVGGGLYHLRCNASEKHRKAMAEVGVAQSVAKIDAAKARYRDMALNEQPSLPLEGRASGPAPRQRRTRKGGEP